MGVNWCRSMVVNRSMLIYTCLGICLWWVLGHMNLAFLSLLNPAFWISCCGRIAKTRFYLGKTIFSFQSGKKNKKICWFPGQFLCFCNWFPLMVLRWIPGIWSWQLSSKKERLNIVPSRDARRQEPLSCGATSQPKVQTELSDLLPGQQHWKSTETHGCTQTSLFSVRAACLDAVVSLFCAGLCLAKRKAQCLKQIAPLLRFPLTKYLTYLASFYRWCVCTHHIDEFVLQHVWHVGKEGELFSWDEELPANGSPHQHCSCTALILLQHCLGVAQQRLQLCGGFVGFVFLLAGNGLFKGCYWVKSLAAVILFYVYVVKRRRRSALCTRRLPQLVVWWLQLRLGMTAVLSAIKQSRKTSGQPLALSSPTGSSEKATQGLEHLQLGNSEQPLCCWLLHCDNDRLRSAALSLWSAFSFVLLVHSSCCKLDYSSLAYGIHCSWKIYFHEKSVASKRSLPGSASPLVIHVALLCCSSPAARQLWRFPWPTPGLS